METNYIGLNLTPLLNPFRDRVKVWSRLKISLAGHVNLIKMIMMPQLLYMLHNTPTVIPLKKFCIINSIFRSLVWQSKPARIKLEQLQRPKEAWGLALPNPWLYYLASQLQHIARAVHPQRELHRNVLDSFPKLLSFNTGSGVVDDLEALHFSKSNRLYPTQGIYHTGNH